MSRKYVVYGRDQKMLERAGDVYNAKYKKYY